MNLIFRQNPNSQFTFADVTGVFFETGYPRKPSSNVGDYVVAMRFEKNNALCQDGTVAATRRKREVITMNANQVMMDQPTLQLILNDYTS